MAIRLLTQDDWHRVGQGNLPLTRNANKKKLTRNPFCAKVLLKNKTTARRSAGQSLFANSNRFDVLSQAQEERTWANLL